jgi:hypothetical protein
VYRLANVFFKGISSFALPGTVYRREPAHLRALHSVQHFLAHLRVRCLPSAITAQVNAYFIERFAPCAGRQATLGARCMNVLRHVPSLGTRALATCMHRVAFRAQGPTRLNVLRTASASCKPSSKPVAALPWTIIHLYIPYSIISGFRALIAALSWVPGSYYQILNIYIRIIYYKLFNIILLRYKMYISSINY